MNKERVIKKILTLSICIAGFMNCGFEFRPDHWIRDISKMWERNTPKVQHVTFWDFDRETYRGIRVFLYTVPQERQNRMVDARLHQKMHQFLSSICEQVITLESMEKSPNRLLVEQMSQKMVEDWKLKGKINPALFFENGNESTPILDVDLFVAIERTYYDQNWKGDEKKLVIGIDAAAFEMDFGNPIYHERVLAESPWYGEKGTYLQAEHATLLNVADAMGVALQQQAKEINQTHIAMEKEKIQSAKEEQALSSSQIKQETQQMRELVRQTEMRMRNDPIPESIIPELTRNLDALKPLLKKIPPKARSADPVATPGKNELTTDDLVMRRSLVAAIQETLGLWDAWKQNEQEAATAPPSLRQPEMPLSQPPFEEKPSVPTTVTQPDNMVGLPNVKDFRGNPNQRAWLIPSYKGLQTNPVPLIPEAGTAKRPNIPSTPLPADDSDSKNSFTDQYLPPPPSGGSASTDSDTEE